MFTAMVTGFYKHYCQISPVSDDVSIEMDVPTSGSIETMIQSESTKKKRRRGGTIEIGGYKDLNKIKNSTA
jgi:hypothetical protein